ncbi:GNAT family N-acetyltransferase [Sediminicurvatus halobius]|uniref:N-acetyltransferase domain-containing protein n=1 Tax=Sediminicurvatus halobius TaxID=2182432 RepID=A0A2U2N2Z8_9GAMM|nr:GNAT family N-acetyltransferase [Spiribacter halobius]PWG63408.1 hypothetical protein DEM34_08860 [Spiribacter halobius]UEX78078.1 GNAT family N-acetyltransferase [Spiribacter halobius]
MQVRAAQLADAPAIEALAERMFSLGRFRGIALNRDKVRAVIRYAIPASDYMLAVAESDNGELAGLHLAQVTAYYFSDQYMAESVAYFVLPHFRGSSAALRLLAYFWRWAEQRGAREAVLGTGPSQGTTLARMDRFLRRAGMSQIGGLYTRPLG